VKISANSAWIHSLSFSLRALRANAENAEKSLREKHSLSFSLRVLRANAKNNETSPSTPHVIFQAKKLKKL